MADSKGTSSPISDVAEFQPSLAEKRQRYHDDLMKKHDTHRGSRYPPFNIEHMPHERQRLAKPMTEEDRFLRRQWLKDQVLHPDEPIHMEELWPRNIIRRMYMAPWDAYRRFMTPRIGATAAKYSRAVIPKLLMGAFSAYAVFYHLKYNRGTWANKGGWHMFTNKPVQYLNEIGFDPTKYEKHTSEFYDRGFSGREALLELRTSKNNYE